MLSRFVNTNPDLQVIAGATELAGTKVQDADSSVSFQAVPDIL